MRRTGFLAIALLATSAGAQQQTRNQGPPSMGGGQCAQNPYNCPAAVNPLPAATTVWLEEMTWMDVRDAVKAGKTTIIIPTGGQEPNGPWLVTGKHNYVLQANCEAIARKMGNALCAPIIKLVPEGNIEPASGHMTSPGTISLREGTFRAVLTDVVTSLKQHGFQHIILIGDSGGNQGGQRAVADSLTGIWKGTPIVAHIQEYYDYAKVAEHMKSKGNRGRDAGQPARRSDHRAQHVRGRSEVDPLRRAREGRQGDDQRRLARRSQEGHRVGEGDRELPRNRHDRGDQQGDREQGDAPGPAAPAPAGMSNALELVPRMGHEQVVFCQDQSAGYRAIIAVHSTVLGPATGGTRFWPYASTDEALVDVLRLSRGMTCKNAAAGLALGGGKAVIIGDSRRQEGREALFLAYGRSVEQLGGRFLTGEDVGTSPADLEIAARVAPRFVAGIDGKGGDPSPWTARGVLRGIQATARTLWGSDDLDGRTMVLQGCGNVGHALALQLKSAGARLIVSDTDALRATRTAAAVNGTVVPAQDVFDQSADLFVPCALGAILNDDTIPRLRVQGVAGAANNQLQDGRHAQALAARGILYAPDYIVNAGGVISGSIALLGETQDGMERRVHAIYDTTLEVFERAQREGVTTATAADRLAESRLREGRG